MKENKILSFK